MSKGSLTVSGTMAESSDGGVWTDSGGITDSVLTISPLDVWSIGSGNTLIIECSDTDNFYLDPISLNLGVLDGVVYVDAETGDDENPGTETEPKSSIQEAVDLADLYYEQAEVHVAEGVYNVNYSLGTHLQMVEGVSILGGYSDDDWAVRDASTQISQIIDKGFIAAPDPDNVTDAYRCRAVDCGTSLTAATVFDGFTVEGGGGSVTIGLNCEASSPAITNCIIRGGTGDFSVAVRIKDCSPYVSGNTMDGGSAADQALGIVTINSTSLIENNVITAGDSDACVGIYNYESSPTINSNIIDGGYANDRDSTGISCLTSSPLITNNRINGGFSYFSASGIYISSESDPTIRNNLIYGGDGSLSSNTVVFGIIIEDSDADIQNNTIDGGDPETYGSSSSMGIEIVRSTPEIKNNIIFTSGGVLRYGIYEFGSGAHPVSFYNNDIFDCATALYSYWNGSDHDDYTNITDVNNPAWAMNNLSDDPLLVNRDGDDGTSGTMDDNDWHLQATSPFLVRTGGLDLSSSFTEDNEGTVRTGNGTDGWSIGAYEQD